jgi:hypothetical protein
MEMSYVVKTILEGRSTLAHSLGRRQGSSVYTSPPVRRGVLGVVAGDAPRTRPRGWRNGKEKKENREEKRQLGKLTRTLECKGKRNRGATTAFTRHSAQGRAGATLERQNFAGHGVVLIGQYHCDRACMHPRIPTTPSPPTLRAPRTDLAGPATRRELGEERPAPSTSN